MSDSFKDSRLYGFFCELRRRKVYRVAAGYGVVGWLIIPVRHHRPAGFVGYVHYYVDRDYDAALDELALARAGLPNDSGHLASSVCIGRATRCWG